MNEGFVKSIITNTNHWYKVGLQQLDWAKKIQGTKCMISRLKGRDKHKDVFGVITISTMKDDENSEKFPYVVVINLEDMLKLYQKSINSLDFYDNNDTIKLGDVIEFSDCGQEFKFQVTDIQTFSHQSYILNRITIQGLVETNSLK